MIRTGKQSGRLRPLGVVPLLLATIITGCHSQVGPQSGRVIFEDGSPVQSGSIEFRDLETGIRYASRINFNGEFHPKNEDDRIGLPPGEYEIVVVQIVLTEDLAIEDHDHGHTVPRRYADYYTSGLKITVAPDQLGDIEISLQTE